MDLETVVRERIADLEKRREEFRQQAERELVAYNAGITELRRLLEPPKPAEPGQPA